jgi:hypothetical protein
MLCPITSGEMVFVWDKGRYDAQGSRVARKVRCTLAASNIRNFG